MTMKIFSTFSGIGGFEIGIQNAYIRRLQQSDTETEQGSDNAKDKLLKWQQPDCIGYSEIDKYAIKVYEKQFKGVPNYGDITKINAEELPDFDCLVGGVPCQAWSIAGKRGGFSDDRGNMWWHFIRILEAKKPTFFVAENVKGLLTHDKGESFRILCEAFCAAGYVIDFELLNSKNFGVPQNRERVYLIGIREDAINPEYVI